MNTLKGSNKVVTDRSGYNAEADLGGLTDDQQISLSPETIDNPDKRESVVTMIHESMHACNFNDVGDDGVYIDRTAEFPLSPVAEKLKNAAHFEVAPRRLLDKDNASDPDDPFAYGGCKNCDPANPAQTFTPAGVSWSGRRRDAATDPARAGAEEGVQDVQGGVDTGLNLHDVFVAAYKAPADWNTLYILLKCAGAACPPGRATPTCCRSGPRSTR